jgi:hypothetical protein
MDAFSPATKKITVTIWRYCAYYFYGMFAKSFNCGITAVDAVIGLAVGAAVSTDVTKPNWKAAASVFGVTFIRSCFMYFRDHPIPEKLPDGTVAPFDQQRVAFLDKSAQQSTEDKTPPTPTP